MNFCNTFPERLYLSKNTNNEIYVGNCQILYKNQINGLRTLYRLFQKKTPGAILNNPAGTGKSVLIALFIEAVRSLLEHPVLILCNNDDEIQHWKQIFMEWTKFVDDDIVVECTNPNVKNKTIFIKKNTVLNSYLRRRWSLVALKGDELTKDIRKMAFDTNFKIWSTTVDVYRDLKLLAGVGKWIDAGFNLELDQYDMRNKSGMEIVRILTLLETFTECMVVRTENVKSIFQETSAMKTDHLPKTAKKNKDPTGTKVKRSKRKITDNIPSKILPKAKFEDKLFAFKIKDDDTEKADLLKVERLDNNGQNNKTDNDSPSILNVEEGHESSFRYTSMSREELNESISHENKEQNNIALEEPDADLISNSVSQNESVDSIDKTKEVDESKETNESKVADEIVMEDINVENVHLKSNDINVSSIDYKIKALEEETLRKFKGSILDSIF